MRPWRLLALSIVTLLAACSAGGSTLGPAFVPQQTSASTAATASYALTGAVQSIALPNLAACHGSVTLPATPAQPGATILTLTTSLTAPTGTAILSSSSSRRPAATGRLNVVCYVTFSVSTAVTLPTVPGFAVTVSPAVTSAGPQQFFYAISQPVAAGTVASYRTEGPATVAGQTLTFSASADPLTLAAHQNYLFAFYATSTVGRAATRLYVANLDNSISVFDLEHGNAPLAKITGASLSRPVAMAVDAAGKLYVADGSTTINIFDTANGNKPLTPITGGEYTGLAIDADGKLYAVSPGAIDMYDTISRNGFVGQIVDVNLDEPHALTIGASGILYALRGTIDGVNPGSLPLGISEYDTRHNDAILPSIEFNKLPIELLYPEDISVDPAGKMYVADFEGNVHVIDTAHGNALLPDVPAQYDPVAAKIDASGKLYVALFEQAPGPNPKIDVDIVDTVNGNVKLGVVTGPNLGYTIAIH